jgi:hypothetical protein
MITFIYILLWTIIAIFVFLLILVLRNSRNHNSAFSNPFKNTRRRKQAEADLKEYLIKWKVLPELWSIKYISAKPTNTYSADAESAKHYHKTNWDFYIEFTFLNDGKGWGSHINNISIVDLTIEPSKNIFSIRRQFVDLFTQLTSVANRYADERNTTVENLKKQYNRDQKLKQLGL